MGSLYLAVGYECNHSCRCCPLTTYDRLHKGLSYDEIVRRLILARQEGAVNHIVLSGGEPMLHPDFLRILELVSKDNSVTVLSNASQCQKREMAKAMREAVPKGRLEIVSAIHSSTPAVHDGITGVKGSLMATLEGLDHLVEEGISITVKHIFNRATLPTLMETFQYLERHYPPEVSFQFCTMDYSGRAGKHAGELFVSMEAIQRPFERVLDYLETGMTIKRNISIIEAPLCLTDPYYWKYYGVASRGLDAYIAPNTDEREADYHVSGECGPYFEACGSCAVQEWCAGIWRSAYRYGGESLLRPIDAIK